MGIRVPSEHAVREIIGLGLAESLQCLLPELPAADYPQLAQRYRHHYVANEEQVLPFSGVVGMLQELRRTGYLLAVATGKGRGGLRRAMAQFGVDDHFDASRCADECFSKPHPAMLQELMGELETIPGRTLMVGDTTHDLQMVANAGCAAVAVAGGAHGRAALVSLAPLACLDVVTDLPQWLTNRR